MITYDHTTLISRSKTSGEDRHAHSPETRKNNKYYLHNLDVICYKTIQMMTVLFSEGLFFNFIRLRLWSCVVIAYTLKMRVPYVYKILVTLYTTIR